jgi:predicted dehydrogenase
VASLAKAHGCCRYSSDLDACLADRNDSVFFDAASTQLRPELLAKAIDAGKHVYCEKPVATTLEAAIAIVRQAKAAGIKHGVVQDKLFLPGIRKLKLMIDAGFFGRLLSVRGEFGYWVFEGDLQPAQRPSWNYRAEDGGGIILDMLCHWRYLLDHTFGSVLSVSCLGATHIPERLDEAGKRYRATADDAAYASFQLAGGVIAHFNSSWATRVRRDDLLTLQVDGTHGSAVAGQQDVVCQQRMATPKPVWNPDVKQPINFYQGWQQVPDTQSFDNGFKLQWEAFIRHVADDAPYTWDLLEGAKGVQLVECAHRSWKERRWIDVPRLAV